MLPSYPPKISQMQKFLRDIQPPPLSLAQGDTDETDDTGTLISVNGVGTQSNHNGSITHRFLDNNDFNNA